MKEWWDIVNSSDNPNVLVMLSGGKDSMATLVLLAEKHIRVTAIHFFHEWGEKIPTLEAERICDQYNVKLIKVNYSEQLFSEIDGYTDGRPCLLCKKMMYSYLNSILKKGEYGWLAIGDNANDTTTIARMRLFDNPFGSCMECSDYLGSEMGDFLPQGVHVLRPLICMSAKQVEESLQNAGITVNRINSTGDKYFEYHREGCPIQFIDNGYPIDRKILKELKEYNCKITEFARMKGILASIHMPSTFIVTIPKGYEQEAAKYLIDNGLYVNYEVNESNIVDYQHVSVMLELSGTDVIKYKSYRKMFARLVERMGMTECKIQEFMEGDRVFCLGFNENSRITMNIDFGKVLSLDFVFKQGEEKKDAKYIENLIIEIFRTRKINLKYDSN